MGIEVAVRVDERGQLQIPDEIQQQFFPGMIVVLSLEAQNDTSSGTNGQPLFPDTHSQNLPAHDGPRIVYKDGIPVIRGEAPPDFDWNTFIFKDRETRLDLLAEPILDPSAPLP